MVPYSVLDLSPIPEGGTAAQALRNSAALARHAEGLGYTRFWMAEHHNMTGIASAATAVALGYVASQTTTIRVGAGGVMLPNHAPLVVAEQFGTLATLYPNRVDLGLGRAPGTDMLTARALRRSLDNSDNFPQDVFELISYFEPAGPGQKVRAIPGAGTMVPVWILGSSLYGAQLAAHLGLPYAFASHFAPAALEQAVEVYRDTYRPSERSPEPHFMLAINVFAADSDEEARILKSSMQQAFVNLRTGQAGPLPRPVADFEERVDPMAKAMVDDALSVSATGSPATIRAELARLIDTHQPDEVILTGQIHDHAARLHSFAIAADAMQQIGTARVAAA
ncbi:LLM class flavin-dependent oxidoreductase [Aurantimonas endophytica]|uniref:Luciferase-like monooxygenase n=1 Tax=Aurantimonas endophytica TaxID=1522175 RepID=A0A7W6HEJ0_9HYPH|nr:LLM class flavin-dependent oxidoreductase [Aurantimonas endophytica]MBB4003764.1 luciferase family oxidoreductase group 1 [Aurantimonas endophytica]MCO6404619.1 MsnO8 family LLM class oxidoreductase [Aurantimonas endophytica]